jgi:MerR family transcriptional regulator, mercuric resistance operon regulatory protein
MNLSYSIGQLAKAADVNVETIRYYERLGLVMRPTKPDQGYRIYTQAILDRVRFIKRAQELGFTLKEIDKLLSLSEARCGDVQALAEIKYEDIQIKIADLHSLASVLKDLLVQCEANPDDAGCPIIQALQPPKK